MNVPCIVNYKVSVFLCWQGTQNGHYSIVPQHYMKKML